MEDEDLLTGSQQPTEQYNDLFTTLQTASSKKFAGATPGAKVYGYDTPLAKSKYDKDLLPDIQLDKDDFFNSLESYRATTQPTSHKLGSALGRLTNIIPESIGAVASALDFEDYFNSDKEVGNWLTNITEEWKKNTNEALPIYRQNNGKSLDFADEGWWIENGSALVQSIGGFAIGGGAITKGLTGLSKLTKAKKLATIIAGANRAEKLGEIAQTGITATMLNQSEAILEATQVYDDTYKHLITQAGGNADPEAQAKAQQKAADAASATINANRLNILLNLTSANLFLRSPKLTRGILTRETTKRNLGLAGLEGGQESAEELINFISGEYGRSVGKDKKYGFDEIIKDLGKPEAAEAALLGFFGGLGQTVITKEGVNRFNTITDPSTGEKVSVRDYNRRAYEQQQETISQLDGNAKASDVKTFTDAFNNASDNIELHEGYKKALEKGDDAEAERFRQLTLNNQAYNAFLNGTTEPLIQMYKELQSGEQKEGMDADYKEKASEAIQKIEKLEKIYNDSAKYKNHQEVYINKGHNYDLINQYEEIDTHIANSFSDLQKQADIITSGTKFDPTNMKGDSYLFDVNNMDFNPAKQAEVGDVEAIKEFNAIKTLIQSSPDYKNWEALKNSKQLVKERLSSNISDYAKITSPEYQTEYVERQAKARQEASNRIDDQVKKVEKEIKADEKVAAKQQRDNTVADINSKIDAQVREAKAQDAQDNDSIENIASQFGKGEMTDLGVIDQALEGQVGTITDIKDNTDGSKDVTIETEDGIVITKSDGISPRYKNNDIDPIYSTEGSETKNTTNQDSIKISNDIDSKKDLQKDGAKLSDVKLMSTYKDSGQLLRGIPQAYLDYERNGAAKTGNKIYFEINKDVDKTLGKSSEFIKAIKLYEKFIKGDTLTGVDKNFMVDYLPLKAKINNSNDIFTYIMSKPFSNDSTALMAYENRSRPLRVSLIKALKDGNDINSLYTTIKGQYGGTLNMDKVEANNNPLELDYINNDIANVELFVINDEGQLIDFRGAYAKGWTKTKDNWKGSTYLKIKKANGKDFYLNLNFGKVSKEQANGIFDIYKSVLDKGIRPTTTINSLTDSIQKSINRNLKAEVDLLQKVGNKSYSEVTIAELLDVVFWDGSKSDKSKLRVNYENQTIEFGPHSYKGHQFTDNVKDEFINWVTTNKNRNFKFKSKGTDGISSLNSTQPDYLEYVFKSGILTTNTKVNEPSFVGFTNLYMTNGISGAKAAPVADTGAYNVVTDGDVLPTANIQNVRYYASPISGKVFKSKLNKPLNEELNVPNADKVGEVITDNDLIARVERLVKSNIFSGFPNIKLTIYEKNSSKTLISQEKIVSLQENELATESTKVTKARKTTKKLTRKERLERAAETRNNKLNKNCRK